MRSRLGTIIESQYGHDDAVEFGGQRNGPRAAAVAALGMRIAQQLHAERGLELRHRARQPQGSPRRLFCDHLQTRACGKCFDRRKVRRRGAVLPRKIGSAEDLAGTTRLQVADPPRPSIRAATAYDDADLESLRRVGRPQDAGSGERSAFTTGE